MESKAKQYLNDYLGTLSAKQRSQYQRFDAYHFCTDEENANLCADLVQQGEKRATASLLWGYEVEGEALPEAGDLVVVTDWAGSPRCIIEITSVETRPFEAVDAQFAFAEGEGDKSLEQWRQVHWQVFCAECDTLGRTPDPQMLVVLERFKVVHGAVQHPSPDQ